MIIQRFNLNLIPNQSPVIVHVNQYDTGTGRLIATLYEGNEPYSPNGTAVIQGTKPDGHGFQYTATLAGNVVTADLTEQMSPVAGDVRAQIVVTESSGVTGTFVFIMRVQPSALPSDTDMSESDYQYIEEAIREAQEAVQTAQEATETAQEAVERAQEAIAETQENAEDSEAWAQGTRGGIPVGPTDPTYEHNAEYWAQYAERYAQGGLHYKGSIPFADIPTTGMREGDMYNITDDFTTDSRFEEGAGIEVKGGTNIAWNNDNKWDVLALPPKTTFNGRSGSILPMAGDYDSKKILLSSVLHIGGETQNDVQEALEALSDDGVKSFNGRSGSVIPMAGDYDSEKILLASVLHIGGETQDNVQKALEALENNKADRVDGAVSDNFAGLDADGNLKDSGKKASDFATPSDIAGQQSLLKDTVGWTGKNLLKNTATSQTINGVTFTVNADKSVTVNGTATANAVLNFPISLPIGEYVFSGTNGQSSGSDSKYYARLRKVGGIQFTTSEVSPLPVESVDGSEIKFNVLQDNLDIIYQICIYPAAGAVSNLTFYPMIRHADITDPTYEPYHESVEVMYEEEIHGVNLLKNEATTQTINGVTFTVNSDGTITANGTATGGYAQLQMRSRNGNPYNLPIGSYIGNGCPANGSESTYQIRYLETIDGQAVEHRDYGEGVKFDVTKVNNMGATIYISNGATVNNLVFKPMLRKADIEDSTYRPYNSQAIQNQLNAQGVLGAKNLLEVTANTQTLSGVTFTVNRDSDGNVMSVTVNGTASANTSYVLRTKTPLAAGKSYIMSRGEVGDNDFQMVATAWNSGSYVKNIIELGVGGYTEKSFVADYNGYNDIQISIFVRRGKSLSNAVVYPMIRLASDPDDTYQPYAMTNRELTEMVFEKRTLTSADDLNNITETGIYGVTTAPANSPEGHTYYMLLVEAINANDVHQIAFVPKFSDGQMYMRVKGGSPVSWRSWFKFTGTIVS